MIAAVLIAVAVMYAASGPVAGFIAAHPTTKTLALAFLMLIGVALVADGFDVHVPRGYVSFAMALASSFEAFIIWEARSLRSRRNRNCNYCFRPGRTRHWSGPQRSAYDH